jgi:hypothetical protein
MLRLASSEDDLVMLPFAVSLFRPTVLSFVLVERAELAGGSKVWPVMHRTHVSCCELLDR